MRDYVGYATGIAFGLPVAIAVLFGTLEERTSIQTQRYTIEERDLNNDGLTDIQIIRKGKISSYLQQRDGSYVLEPSKTKKDVRGIIL